jgi:hypothetical protein
MIRRKFESEGQLPLFGDEVSSNTHVDEGVAVNISIRRSQLLNVLSEYGKYRQLAGLCHVTDPVTNHPDRVKIIDRYGAGTEVVIDNSLNKVVTTLNHAKLNFAHAAGHYALIEAGFDQKDVKALSRQMFEEFTTRFFTNEDATKQRRKLKRNLEN